MRRESEGWRIPSVTSHSLLSISPLSGSSTMTAREWNGDERREERRKGRLFGGLSVSGKEASKHILPSLSLLSLSVSFLISLCLGITGK